MAHRLLQLGAVKIAGHLGGPLVVAGDAQSLADQGHPVVVDAGLQLGAGGDDRPAASGGQGPIAGQAFLEAGIETGFLAQGGHGALELGRGQGLAQIGDQGGALGTLVMIPVFVNRPGVDLAVPDMMEQTQQAIAEHDLGLDPLLAL